MLTDPKLPKTGNTSEGNNNNLGSNSIDTEGDESNGNTLEGEEGGVRVGERSRR